VSVETLKRTPAPVLPWKRMDGLVKRNATYADLDGVPDNKVAELIDGNLYIHSRPRVAHARAISRLMGELSPADRDRKKGWVILQEVEIWMTKRRTTVLVPDLAGWRRERMPAPPNVQTIEMLPDWVCEGLSPSTARHDKGRKLEVYAKNKIPHVWYVDPTFKTVEILAFARGSYRIAQIVGGDDRGTYPPFTHEIDLSALWD
jgi:Uma2 family endonuclease